ncbi:MAG: hypothetical protein ACLT98_17045 [Eggerthellaceae bacterium]
MFKRAEVEAWFTGYSSRPAKRPCSSSEGTNLPDLALLTGTKVRLEIIDDQRVLFVSKETGEFFDEGDRRSRRAGRRGVARRGTAFDGYEAVEDHFTVLRGPRKRDTKHGSKTNARKRAENEGGPATNDSRPIETGRTAAYHIAATSC